MPDRTKTIVMTIILIVVVVVVAAIFLGNKWSRPNTASTQTATSTADQRCPENYATDEERSTEDKSFITDFLTSNPQGTIADYVQARIDFLTKNNCTQTLKYIQDNGGIEGYIKTMMNDLTSTDTPAISTTTIDPHTATSGSSIKIASSSANDLYALSSTERNSFLLYGNNTGKYQVVVNATNDGIQNHRALIWDDVDFWTHRGFALYELGDCAGAGAAFYHVLMRASKDSTAYEVASGLMADTEDKSCGVATSSDNAK